MKTFEIKKTLSITDSDIDGLMVTALEGGINYWCGSATIVRDKEGLIAGINGAEGVIYASDVISKGGSLIMTDVEAEEGDDTDPWELTQEKFLKGLAKAMDWAEVGTVDAFIDGHDAEWADVLIQYALFDEIVFG
jgi:hypothetical protein